MAAIQCELDTARDANAALSGPDDPERRAEMGRAGRRRVEEMFSWRAVAATVAAAYEDVIASWQTTGPMTGTGRKGRASRKWGTSAHR